MVAFTHVPTGARICVLPAPAAYRAIRHKLLNPYAATVHKAFGDHTLHGLRYALLAALRDVAPYLTTPLRLLARELRRAGCKVILCQDYEHPRFGRLLDDPTRRHELGLRARHRAENFFSLDAIGVQLRDFLFHRRRL